MPDSATVIDERFMQAALLLAAKGQGSVEPNPMVGCVLVRDNQIIGQGHHARFGGPHAEVAALDSLPNIGDARGATAYVTLEPCCHHGKTPPCSEALIVAGVQRVVVAVQDPHTKVDGGGLMQLHEAGISTTVGVLKREARQLIAPYLKRVQHQMAYVIAKWAMTMDGKIATVTGESQWITGQQSRAHVHTLRGRVDAIIVGMGTVRADDPLLTARPPGPRTARRVVFCRSRLPSVQSRLIQSIDDAPVTLIVSPLINDSDLQPLRQRKVEVFRCECDDARQMVMPALRHLADLGATNVLLEGGGQLLASFAAVDQIDECQMYVGPKIFAGDTAPGPIGGSGTLAIGDALQFDLESIDQFDDDIRVIYRRNRS
jgi:diaminohydroxyphosphoribosylaminopyrimidine deaminase/5-amino-6-(5-phosphoribosylamino)uracil reductase